MNKENINTELIKEKIKSKFENIINEANKKYEIKLDSSTLYQKINLFTSISFKNYVNESIKLGIIKPTISLNIVLSDKKLLDRFFYNLNKNNIVIIGMYGHIHLYNMNNNSHIKVNNLPKLVREVVNNNDINIILNIEDMKCNTLSQYSEYNRIKLFK